MHIGHKAIWIGGFALGLAGCAGGFQANPVTPEELDQLDARALAHARDADELTMIGIRFYEAGRLIRATEVLGAVQALDPTVFPAMIYRGLAFERLAGLDSARAVYQSGLDQPLTGSQHRELEGRLTLLARRTLRRDIRTALAQESVLTRNAPSANTIAVLPWRFVGRDSSLRPLERGLAHLLVTDLAKIEQVTLLERERVQVLLDEMALGEAGRIDLSTAARSGRILGAGHVIQGVLRETGAGGLSLEAQAVRTDDGQVTATSRVTNAVADLFTMEKEVVLDLVGQMGLTLSPAESRAISERPTADLQAFLAFSRGLEAQDRGEIQVASTLFARAAAQDPMFVSASRQAVSAARAANAGATVDLTPGLLSAATNATRLGVLQHALQVIAPSAGGTLEQRTMTRLPVTRPRLPEALRQDDAGRLTILGDIIIVIPRP